MKKQYLHTLIALAVLAALWGVFYFVGRKKAGKTPESKKASAGKIVPVSRDHITAFALKPQNGRAITCIRQKDKTWQITEPLKVATDPSTLDGFLNSLTDATVDKVVDEHAANLKEFGLDPPEETLEVTTDAKPSKITLLLGASTPTNQGFYARVAGQPRVIMLASYMKDSLEKSLFDLRNKQVVTLASDQIGHLVVSSRKGSYTLVKNPEGVWDLVLPPPVRADHFTVEGIVDELGSASMKSVVAEHKKNLSDYGFSNPTLTLHLSGSGGGQTLVIGKKHGDQYYAMNTSVDPVFTVGSDFLSQLQKDPADLRSKDLFTFSTFEVHKITVDAPQGHLAFQKQKDKWAQSAPASQEVPGAKIETLLDNLRNLSAQSFPQKHATNLASYGLNKPIYTFQVQYGTPGKTQTVMIAKAGEHIYARRSTDLVPSELSKDALASVEKALKAL